MIMLGGMIGPQVEALAITPAASWAEYPSLTMAGIRIPPMQDEHACAEPVMPPKNMLDTMPAWARLPGSRPISSMAKRMSFSVMPPRFMISPASIKNGIASRGRLPMPLNMEFETARVAMGVLVVTPSATRLSVPVNSRETYTGMPARIKTKVRMTSRAIIKPTLTGVRLLYSCSVAGSSTVRLLIVRRYS